MAGRRTIAARCMIVFALTASFTGAFKCAIDASATDAQSACDVRDFLTLSKESDGIFSLGASGRFPAFVFSERLRLSNTLTLPFKHHLALELGHRGKHIEHEA